jgi:anti-sigma factor ChrR (cupin superfamily)
MRIPNNRMILMVVLAISLIGFSVTKAEEAKKMQPQVNQSQDIVITPSDINWVDAPPEMPPGAKISVLEGDPTKPGPYTIRLKTPANYKLPAHGHSKTERITVISGTFNVGMGDKFDTAKGKALPAGSFFILPTKMHHFAWSNNEEVVVQINGDGPFDIDYINPADDPRNTK